MSKVSNVSLATEAEMQVGVPRNIGRGSELFIDKPAGIYTLKAILADGSVITFPGGAGSDVIIANTAFVSENGNDGTAIIGDLNKTFLTIEAAHAAAVAGTSIYVFAGNYTISTGLYKTEVTGYHFEPGVNINCIAAWMFNGLLSGVGLNLNVTGGANITCLGGFVRSAAFVGNNNISIIANSVTWNTNIIFINSNTDSKISLNASGSLIGGVAAGFTYVDAPDTILEINCPYISTNLGNIIFNGNGSTTVINAAKYIANSTSPVASQGQLDTAGSKMVFNCGVMNINALNNDLQGVFFINGTGGIIEINSEIIHTAGVMLSNARIGTIIYNKSINSLTGTIYVSDVSAKTYINADFISGASYFGAVVTENGSFIFIGPYLVRSTLGVPVIFNSAVGKVSLSGTRLITDTALIPPIDNSGIVQIAGEVLQNQASVGAAPVSGTLTTLAGVF